MKVGILDAMDVETACPGCGRRLTLNLGQGRRTRRITCPGCGQAIDLKFVGDDLGNVDRAYRELEQEVRKLGGTIRITKR
jgi:pyruvate/2-oxoacid:ferredoxin oxidoreductase beta subunit